MLITVNVKVGPRGVRAEFNLTCHHTWSPRYVHDIVLHTLRLRKFTPVDLSTCSSVTAVGALRLDTLKEKTIKRTVAGIA